MNLHQGEEAHVTYDDVNGAWGAAILPAITKAEVVPLAAKLFAKFAKHPDIDPIYLRMPSWFRRGRRCWANTKPQDTKRYANGGHNGLGRMIHDCSHYLFEVMHPQKLTHSHVHAALELKMIQYAMRKGWHVPKPKPEPKPKPSKTEARALKLQRTEASIARFEAKLRRAENALRKLRRRKAALERAQEVAQAVHS
jgi:hypothetical protein